MGVFVELTVVIASRPDVPPEEELRTAVAADFRRLNDVRPGYGYAGVPDSLKRLTHVVDISEGRD